MHVQPCTRENAGHKDLAASITGIDLANLSESQVQQIRQVWLQHPVLSFPDQPLEHTELEQFTLAFGGFGHDPYVEPIDGHTNVLEVRREPDEKVAPFGSAWHSDWSFQATPPAATILHAKVVPPVGGETWYADGYAAFDALPVAKQEQLLSLSTIHSARRPYSHQGFLAGGGKDRSMTILPSDSALETQVHPLVRTHPESGRKALWVNQVYTISIKEMATEESDKLLAELFTHCTDDKFVYRHQWQPNMLTMWDNRCVQHNAQGGYDGHRRVLHRTTLAGDAPI